MNFAKRILANMRGAALPKIVAGAGHLLIGNVIGSVISLVSFALTARILTPADFGLLTLIVTGVTLIGKFIGFQSWHAVVRFGAEKLVGDDQTGLAAVIRCGVLLDAFAATLAGTASLALGYAGSAVFDWGHSVFLMISIYSVTQFTNLTGTAIGILRLTERFDRLAVHVILATTVKLAVVIPLFLTGAGIVQFVFGWALAQVLSNLLLIYFGYKQLQSLGIVNTALHESIGTVQAFRKMRGFFFLTNIDGMVRVARDLDVPILGSVLGTEGVGIYKVGRQVAGLLMKVVDPFYAAVYPYLARAIPAGDIRGFRKIIRLSALGVGCFCAVGFGFFVAFGYDLIRLFFSESYVAAYDVVVWCLAGVVVWGFAHPLGPALLALGFAGRFLLIHGLFTAAYLAMTAGFAETMGATGAAIAYFVFFLSWGASMLWIVQKKQHHVSPQVGLGERSFRDELSE